MDRNEVNAAFEILLEEIEMVTNAINEAGAQAIAGGQYEKAQECIDTGKRLEQFHAKVKELQAEWSRLFAARVPRARRGARRRVTARLPRGLRTPEHAFRRPILQALTECGGSAPMQEVLELVEKRMEAILSPHDREPLPSDPKAVRWRNTAQWCRAQLVREGLMRPDSPRGIWQISDSGVRVLSSGQV